MYLILLPLLSFLMIFYALWRRRPGRDPRVAFMSAAIIWGVVTTATTELLTLPTLLTLETLVVCWTTVMLGSGLIAVRSGSLRMNRSRWTPRPPALATMATAAPILVILLATGLICVFGWPNQWDTLVYHLSRVDHWVQNRSVAFYPTHIVRQLFNPPWAEYATLHLTVLGGD